MKFELIEINKIDTYEVNSEIVYDLEVEKDSSFCVEDNIVVHNSGCTTKNATGIYQGMFSLLQDCYKYKIKNNRKAAIIADGGISSPDRMCKAIASGACVVMLGGAIARCKDSPAEFYSSNQKIHYGSASYENQKDFKDNPKYIEGKQILLPMGETIEEEIGKFMNGLRSSMSYFNARNLEEYRNNVTFYKTK